MNESFNSIEFFTKYASETHRSIKSYELEIPVTAFNKIALSKRHISIPYDQNKELFLLCYNNPQNFSKHPFYCGIFFQSIVFIEHELTIKKLFFIDRINPFNFTKHRFKTNTSFDSKVIIETNDESEPLWILNHELQKFILELFEIDQRITIGLNLIHPDYEESLLGKSTFGIFIDDWIFDTKKIEKLFEIALRLKKIIK